MNMSDKLPSAAGDVAQAYPDIWKAYSDLGEACAKVGPLDQKTLRLVKLALAIGVASEGATHSHTRRATAEGISADELKQVAMLAVPTLGFPRAVAALTWIEDVTDPD
jgi:alkylhydroperoxidase/carboxymuconolactone decarboxylase family protein YurZ